MSIAAIHRERARQTIKSMIKTEAKKVMKVKRNTVKQKLRHGRERSNTDNEHLLNGSPSSE